MILCRLIRYVAETARSRVLPSDLSGRLEWGRRHFARFATGLQVIARDTEPKIGRQSIIDETVERWLDAVIDLKNEADPCQR